MLSISIWNTIFPAKVWPQYIWKYKSHHISTMIERRDIDFPSETMLQKLTLATDGFSRDPSVWICQTMSLAMRSKTPTFNELVKTSNGVNIGWECQEMDGLESWKGSNSDKFELQRYRSALPQWRAIYCWLILKKWIPNDFTILQINSHTNPQRMCRGIHMASQ